MSLKAPVNSRRKSKKNMNIPMSKCSLGNGNPKFCGLHVVALISNYPSCPPSFTGPPILVWPRGPPRWPTICFQPCHRPSYTRVTPCTTLHYSNNELYEQNAKRCNVHLKQIQLPWNKCKCTFKVKFTCFWEIHLICEDITYFILHQSAIYMSFTFHISGHHHACFPKEAPSFRFSSSSDIAASFLSEEV